MNKLIISPLLKLSLAFACCMVISSILWEHYIVGNIYSCVWEMAYIDFFFPDNWYHDADGGDMIKPGWTLDKLKTLWYCIIGVSFFVSAAFALSGNVRKN